MIFQSVRYALTGRAISLSTDERPTPSRLTRPAGARTHPEYAFRGDPDHQTTNNRPERRAHAHRETRLWRFPKSGNAAGTKMPPQPGQHRRERYQEAERAGSLDRDAVAKISVGMMTSPPATPSSLLISPMMTPNAKAAGMRIKPYPGEARRHSARRRLDQKPNPEKTRSPAMIVAKASADSRRSAPAPKYAATTAPTASASTSGRCDDRSVPAAWQAEREAPRGS